MKRKEGQNFRLNELPENPLYELRRCGAGNALFDKELKAYQRLFEEDEVMDDSYKILLLCLFTKEERFEPQTKPKGRERANEPLLCIPMKGERFQPRMKLKDKDHLIEHDGVRKNAGKTLEEGFEPNKKRKDKDHLIEHDDVRENAGKALKQRFEPLEKLKDKDRLIEHNDVRVNAGKVLKQRFEPLEKLKDKDHLIEHGDVRKNAGKALKERFEPLEKLKDKDHLIEHDGVRENARKALKERLELQKKRKGKYHLIEHDDVREIAGEENNPEYEFFLKHLKELGKSYAVEYKKDSINVVIKYVKDIGSDKDCEPEPRRKSSRIMKQNLGLLNQVPNVEKPRENGQKANSVKSSRTGRKLSNGDEKVEIEKFSSCELRNVVMKQSRDDDEKVEMEKCSACDLRNVVMKKSRDDDEKVEIEKCSARDFRDVVMKRPRNEAEKAEIEKCSARELRSVVMKRTRDEDEKVEIEKCSARELRSVVMKKSRVEDEKVEIEKLCSPSELRNVIMKKSRDEDEKVEMEKCSARDFRNVVMKKTRDEDEDVEIEKCSARDFRNVVMKKPRNVAEKAEIEKLPARDFSNVRGANKSSMLRMNINKKDDEKESDDSDVEILDMNAACLKGSFVSSKKFGKNVEENGSRSSDSSDEFRRQVLGVLTKPFDKDEYIVLKTEFEARCYTDYHPDLVRKLKKYRYNQRKRLAILRGFFFWLQNLTREGAFKPWKDGVCLAVEPQSPETNPGNYTSGS